VGDPPQDTVAHDAKAAGNVDAVLALSPVHTHIALDEHVQPYDFACGSGGGKGRRGNTVCCSTGAQEAG